MISNHYERANNTYMGDLIYDEAKPTKYILYLCTNNLYGCVSFFLLEISSG